MLETAIKLTELPWATVLTLAAGYCGYFIAHIGVRSHHQAADVTFGTLVFGFWGLLAYQLVNTSEWLGLGAAGASIVGFAASVLVGAAWSGFARRLTDRTLRVLGVTLYDDCPSAWAAIGRDPQIYMTQMSVKLVNGDIYLTSDLSSFANVPNGPCIFGGSGDILMFVTHVYYAGADDYEEVDLGNSPELGYEATYIPKEQIVRVEFRQKRANSFLRRSLRRRVV